MERSEGDMIRKGCDINDCEGIRGSTKRYDAKRNEAKRNEAKRNEAIRGDPEAGGAEADPQSGSVCAERRRQRRMRRIRSAQHKERRDTDGKLVNSEASAHTKGGRETCIVMRHKAA